MEAGLPDEALEEKLAPIRLAQEEVWFVRGSGVRHRSKTDSGEGKSISDHTEVCGTTAVTMA